MLPPPGTFVRACYTLMRTYEAEVTSSRARERLSFRNHGWDGRYEIPTFDEVIELAQQLGGERGRPLGVCPETKHTRLVIPPNPDGTLLPPTDLVARAHAVGLLVHVWTLRSEPAFLSPSYHDDPGAEFRQFRDLGVDGIFTDFADEGVRALRTGGTGTR